VGWGLDRPGPKTTGRAFSIDGIVGTNVVDVDVPEGWIPEAVLLPDGRDILDQSFPFEPGKHYEGVRVILSDRLATIRGSVPERTSPVSSFRAIAFPEDEALREVWRHTKGGEVDDRGNFSIKDLRPGTAYLVAISRGDETRTLEELAPSATRVYLDNPGVFTVTLKR
jgi:hypothetical protein